MNKFEQWFNSIGESLTSPVKTEPEVSAAAEIGTDTATAERPTSSVPSSSRDEMMSDVDAIMHSLEVLSKELTEELEQLDSEMVKEGAAEVGGKVMQWMWYGPKAAKAQAKVNKMKLNLIDMQFAADNAPNAEQKSSITKKVSQMKDSIKGVQDALNDRFKDRGEIVNSMIKKVKLQGEIEAQKKISGMSDDPAEKASAKQKMAEIQKKYTEEIESLKELEPSEEEKKEAAKKKEEEKKAEQKKIEDAEKEAEKKKKEEKEATDNEPQDGEPKNNEPQDGEPKNSEPQDGEPKTDDPKKDALKKEIENLESALNDLKAKEKKSKDDQNKIDVLSISIANKKKQLEEGLQHPQVFLINTALELGLNEMAKEINSKKDWQFENNSALYLKYKMEIDKASAAKVLNESRYFGNGIADNFKKLI